MTRGQANRALALKAVIAPAGIAVAIAAVTLVSGCAATCSATPQRLATLRRGMTYAETSQIMGCPGAVVTANSPADSTFAIVEWNGPDSPLFTRTQIDFQDGKLLSYTTGRRGAL
jgi:hypothetical protein